MVSRDLSESIKDLFDDVTKVFGDFQKNSGLNCPAGCGKCCFKPEGVYCAPYELLPMALHLLDANMAEEFLEKAKAVKTNRCLFLNVEDETKGLGKCSQYEFRPYICRAFGVSARIGKNERIDYSICRVLKSNDQLPEFQFSQEEIPFIEIWKKKLMALDPRLLDQEIPINTALILMLEKVLLWSTYQKNN